METLKIHPSVQTALDVLLRQKVPAFVGSDVSNSKIRRLIVAGKVSVNGRQIRIPSFSVRAGSAVCVSVDKEKLFYEKQPDDIAFELTEKDVLFEDDNIIVVNKPSFFPVEAGFVGSRDNLHAAVVRYLHEKNPSLRNPPYAGIMHRLDRETSGAVLFTKSRAVNAPCHDMFENHTVEKKYMAVCQLPAHDADSYYPGRTFSVEFPMGRISPSGQCAKWGRVSSASGGLYSKTDFTVVRLSQIGGMKVLLIEAELFTGRTHQIRVHLSSSGLPILGDVLYGGKPYKRIMLHAFSLSFPHPVTGNTVKVECPFPDLFISI